MKDAKENTTTVKTAAMAVIAALIMVTSVYAGDLEPSAPPAAGGTMKTLDEVEPRIPIHADDLPMTITESGSYYFTESIEYAAGNTPITIEANDVTVDLMGYTLKGPDSGYSYGIKLSECSNVEVRNGTVRDFYRGITTYSTGSDHRIINIRAVSNTVYGIYLATAGCMVKDCTASGNGNIGIYTGIGCTVKSNTAYDNGNSGIYVDDGCTVQNNTAYGNDNYGIHTGSGCTVKSNTAYDNTSLGISTGSGCTVNSNTAYDNTGFGIYTSSGCTVQNNTAYANDNYGIHTGESCTVTGNTSRANTSQGGIWVDDKSTIIGNTATDNTGWGLYCSQNCLVDQNTAVDNTNNMYSYNCTVGTNHAP